MSHKDAEKPSGHSSSDLGSEWHPAIRAGYSDVKSSAQGIRRRRILVQCPLDFYLQMNERDGKRKGGITYRQWEAGNKLFSDWHRAGLVPSSMPNIGKIRIPPKSPEREFSSSQEDAQDGIRKARHALGGHQNTGWILVRDVCCFGYYLREVPPMKYYKKTEHLMARLCEALDQLADFYAIPDGAKPRKKRVSVPSKCTKAI